MRDFQRSKVYEWEQTYVAPKDRNSGLDFDSISFISDYIWMMEDLQHPPKILPLDSRDQAGGKGERLALYFPKERKTPTWIIIHEIAHALTSEIEGNSHRHGPYYVGCYIHLLSKYLKLDPWELRYTASTIMGIEIDIYTGPTFLK